MPTCKLIIKDEINIKWENVGPATRRKMVESLKFFIPYAKHLNSYKLGRWDGTVSFATIGGSSYLNLLEVLLPIVENDGYKIELEDHRIPHNFTFPIIDENFTSYINWPEDHQQAGKPVKLRDYQVEAINAFLSNTQSIGRIATGAGKTLISAVLAKIVENYGRTIIIVPSKSLVLQTENDYKMLGLDVGVYFGDRKEPNHHHTITTWQSLNVVTKKKKTEEEILFCAKFLENMVCVIVDEAHGTKADSLRSLMSDALADTPIRWGLTGTIPKEDYQAIPLLACIGPVIHKLDAKELQDKGILANCHINILQLLEVTQYKTYAEEHDFLVTNDIRVRWLAKFIDKTSQTGNTLILVTRRETGKLLEELIPDSVFIYGETKTQDRKEHYDEISVVDKKVIIASYGVASTGINIPRIFNLILLEPGRSFIRTIQSIGRGLRKAEDKERVNIFDLASTCKFSARHLAARKKFYNEAGYPFTQEKVDYLK